MFLGEKIQSVDEFINRLEEYIAYWNNERISPVLGQELKTLLEMSFTMQKECGDRNGRRLRCLYDFIQLCRRAVRKALCREPLSHIRPRVPRRKVPQGAGRWADGQEREVRAFPQSGQRK